MAFWRRGSRRLALVLWTVIVVILLRYRDTISSLVTPNDLRLVPFAPGSEKQAGAATPASHGKKPVDAANAPTAATPPKKKKTGLESAKYFVKSGYDWSKLRRHYPIAPDDMVHPPKGPPKSLQRVQYAFPRAAFALNDKQQGQRDAVRNAFKRAWDAYVEHGFPNDELTPVTLRGKDTFGGWAATMVDALDTLYIMGFHDEFDAMLPSVGAIDWSGTELSSLNVFETNIRYLGGLLAAYDLSGEEVLLLKAVELGELLYAAFDTPNHMPPFVSRRPIRPLLVLTWTTVAGLRRRQKRQPARRHHPAIGLTRLPLPRVHTPRPADGRRQVLRRHRPHQALPRAHAGIHPPPWPLARLPRL